MLRNTVAIVLAIETRIPTNKVKVTDTTLNIFHNTLSRVALTHNMCSDARIDCRTAALVCPVEDHRIGSVTAVWSVHCNHHCGIYL